MTVKVNRQEKLFQKVFDKDYLSYHSERSEESLFSLFKRRDPSALQPQGDKEREREIYFFNKNF